jgi:MSHA biogenesis protein MshP
MKSGDNRRRQRGLGLATALFVITAMGLLAAMIFQLVRSSGETTQEEVLLLRAFHAAESGVQFGLNYAFPPSGDPTACPVGAPPGTPNTYPDFEFEADGLNACTAAVTCNAIEVGGDTFYTITSTGTCGDVSRTIQVRAR